MREWKAEDMFDSGHQSGYTELWCGEFIVGRVSAAEADFIVEALNQAEKMKERQAFTLETLDPTKVYYDRGEGGELKDVRVEE